VGNQKKNPLRDSQIWQGVLFSPLGLFYLDFFGAFLGFFAGAFFVGFFVVAFAIVFLLCEFY
jgi:hypothetical protein